MLIILLSSWNWLTVPFASTVFYNVIVTVKHSLIRQKRTCYNTVQRNSLWFNLPIFAFSCISSVSHVSGCSFKFKFLKSFKRNKILSLFGEKKGEGEGEGEERKERLRESWELQMNCFIVWVHFLLCNTGIIIKENSILLNFL